MTNQCTKAFSRRKLVVVVGVMLALLVALYAADRVLLNPWSMGLGGQPTLTGYWEGTVDVAAGDRRNVVVQLRYHLPITTGASPTGWDSLKGAIEVCGPAGTLTSGPTGEPENRSGSRFGVDPWNATGPGLRLGRLRGQWEGDRITAQSETYTVRADGSASGSGEDHREATFELRRSSKAAYERTC